MRILITGNRGFVGASFGRYAAASGHEILGISRSSQPEPGWPGHHVAADAAQADLSGTIRDFDPHLILQAAGSASVGGSIEDPIGDFRATSVTLMNVLEGVRRSGRQPLIIFPSSAAVYGNPANLPVAEGAPLAPISPYGYHKAACEIHAREYSQCFGLSIVVCRLFSLFGYLQRRLLVWEIFAQLVGDNEQVQLKGTGSETRDFLHVDDFSRACLLLSETAPRNASIILNVAGGRETMVMDLVSKMQILIGTHKEVRTRGVARPGDPARWFADITELRELIPAWKPQDLSTSLEETLSRWTSGSG